MIIFLHQHSWHEKFLTQKFHELRYVALWFYRHYCQTSHNDQKQHVSDIVNTCIRGEMLAENTQYASHHRQVTAIRKVHMNTMKCCVRKYLRFIQCPEIRTPFELTSILSLLQPKQFTKESTLQHQGLVHRKTRAHSDRKPCLSAVNSLGYMYITRSTLIYLMCPTFSFVPATTPKILLRQLCTP